MMFSRTKDHLILRSDPPGSRLEGCGDPPGATSFETRPFGTLLRMRMEVDS